MSSYVILIHVVSDFKECFFLYTLDYYKYNTLVVTSIG